MYNSFSEIRQLCACVPTTCISVRMCVCVCVSCLCETPLSLRISATVDNSGHQRTCALGSNPSVHRTASHSHTKRRRIDLWSALKELFKLAHDSLWIKIAHKLKINFHSATDGHLIPMTQFLLSASLEIYLCLLCCFVTWEFSTLETCLGDTSLRNCAFNVKSI